MRNVDRVELLNRYGIAIVNNTESNKIVLGTTLHRAMKLVSISSVTDFLDGTGEINRYNLANDKHSRVLTSLYGAFLFAARHQTRNPDVPRALLRVLLHDAMDAHKVEDAAPSHFSDLLSFDQIDEMIREAEKGIEERIAKEEISRQIAEIERAEYLEAKALVLEYELHARS
jgi:hypothetical protein